MIILDFEQGSDEWHAARVGIPTASNFKKIVTPAKGNLSKTADNYLYELLSERLTGVRAEGFRGEYMERGVELEPEARKTYEFIQDVEVAEVGLVMNDQMTIGVSPDGLIGDNGGLEIKCLKPSTLVKYILKDDLPLEYKPQVMGNLWITEREWWDFFAYAPGLPIFLKRVYRDEEYIDKMAKHIAEFVERLNEAEKKIREKL